jgi:hypothetical protein
MQNVRVFWDAEAGWTVETPFALSTPQALAVVSWVKKVQGPRVATMRGDKRSQAGKALAELSLATLKQTVVAKPNSELVLFERGK